VSVQHLRYTLHTYAVGQLPLSSCSYVVREYVPVSVTLQDNKFPPSPASIGEIDLIDCGRFNLEDIQWCAELYSLLSASDNKQQQRGSSSSS